MLHDPARHEALQPIAWDEARVRAAIVQIAADTERRFSPDRYWPLHPLDIDPKEDPALIVTSLYFGACGVIWALEYLQSVGAVSLSRDPCAELDLLLSRNRDWLRAAGSSDDAS